MVIEITLRSFTFTANIGEITLLLLPILEHRPPLVDCLVHKQNCACPHLVISRLTGSDEGGGSRRRRLLKP